MIVQASAKTSIAKLTSLELELWVSRETDCYEAELKHDWSSTPFIKPLQHSGRCKVPAKTHCPALLFKHPAIKGCRLSG